MISKQAVHSPKVLLLFVCLAAGGGTRAQAVDPGEFFLGSDQCIACHSNMLSDSDHDVSIGYTWRASMMANSARDPYWLASVRREVIDHPGSQAAIEDKCATCHLPMARFQAAAAGELGRVFEHFTAQPSSPLKTRLAEDGVSCTVCHQIEREGLGHSSSFTGGFKIDTSKGEGTRAVFGPYEIDAGRQRIMHSATAFVPTEADHIGSSELCATCHTLYTHALNETGDEVGKLPEQVPYLEWQHSDFRETQSCQSCHMPELDTATPITSVLGEPRENFSQHVFRGGNVFMLRMLNRYRSELGVKALPAELDATAIRTEQFLQSESASLRVEASRSNDSQLDVVVDIENLAGHKLPTAYPSRRAWLYLMVADAGGRKLFESGALRANGSIVGNDNDADPDRFEPHYQRIEHPEQVQIYEPILVDYADRVTTGLLYGMRYIKDNRLLPQGFDKQSAAEDIAVHGSAAADDDFGSGGDRVEYNIDVAAAEGPLNIRVELRYQSIAFRWARNLKGYSATETQRFVRYYEASSENSMVILANASLIADDESQ